jgi:hypothetical protein
MDELECGRGWKIVVREGIRARKEGEREGANSRLGFDRCEMGFGAVGNVRFGSEFLRNE